MSFNSNELFVCFCVTVISSVGDDLSDHAKMVGGRFPFLDASAAVGLELEFLVLGIQLFLAHGRVSYAFVEEGRFCLDASQVREGTLIELDGIEEVFVFVVAFGVKFFRLQIFVLCHTYQFLGGEVHIRQIQVVHCENFDTFAKILECGRFYSVSYDNTT